MHAQVYHDHGFCPHNAKNIFATKIPVDFFGAIPFIYYMYNPISGSDIILAKILAEKHGLNLKLNPAKATSDLVQRVS